MAKKIKPARRPSKKLIEAARDYVLHAFDQATDLLTDRERMAFIVTLREDLNLHQSQLHCALETLDRLKRRAAP